MLIENTTSRTYEKPATGQYLGTVIDVVDLGQVKGRFGTRSKIRIVWVLNANDSEGNPYRVMVSVNATMNERSNLYQYAEKILGKAPSVPFESEELIGRSNTLWIQKEGEYANVKGIAPMPSNTIGPSAPAGFIRSKDRTQGSFSSPFQSSATTYQPPAQPNTAPASTAAAPTQKPKADAGF